MKGKERFNNAGKLTINSVLKNKKSPKFNGLLTIDEVTYWVSAWEKPHPVTGMPFLSLNIIEKDGKKGYEKKGTGSLYIGQNSAVTGNLVFGDDQFTVDGRFNNQTIPFSIVRTTEKSNLVTLEIDVLRHHYEKLEDLAESKGASVEAVISRLIKVYADKIQIP